MKRITPEIKRIADAHIQAKVDNNFNPAPFNTADEVRSNMRKGHTYDWVLDDIEIRYVSVTSNIIARSFNYRTDAYKRGVYKGFKVILG